MLTCSTTAAFLSYIRKSGNAWLEYDAEIWGRTAGVLTIIKSIIGKYLCR